MSGKMFSTVRNSNECDILSNTNTLISVCMTATCNRNYGITNILSFTRKMHKSQVLIT